MSEQPEENVRVTEGPVRKYPEQPPMWQGDREYLQAQYEKSWTPERYGGWK